MGFDSEAAASDAAMCTYWRWQTATNTPTGPTTVVRDDWAHGYTETLTMTAAPHLTAGRPDGTETFLATDLRTLTRSVTNLAGQVVATDEFFTFAGLT
jgi:hypothetical protein